MEACQKCRFPGAKRDRQKKLHHEVPDFEHGLELRADFYLCPACGHVSQFPLPAEAAIPSLYPIDYRPHVAGSGPRFRLLNRLKNLQAHLLLWKLRPVLKALLQSAQNPRVLELGCGSGGVLRALRDSGFNDLTGIDLNADLASVVSGNGIRFIAADIENLPENLGGFDLIFMNYVLEHVLNPEKLMLRLHGLLRTRGRIVILTPNAQSFAHIFFGRFWAGLHAPRHFEIFSSQSLKNLIEKTGFVRVQQIYLIDPASWALSFQNWVESILAKRSPKGGTAFYTLFSMPFWIPLALVERMWRRSSSMIAIIAASG